MSGYFRMRRDLSRTIRPIPLPAGTALLSFSIETARAGRELLRRVHPEGLGDGGMSFEGFWTWLTTDPEFDPELVFIAAADGGVVGLCHCWRVPFIKDLAVDPSHQGRGIGTALLTLALQAFAQRGAPSVDLKTDVENTRAQRLYQRLGFEIVERVDP